MKKNFRVAIMRRLKKHWFNIKLVFESMTEKYWKVNYSDIIKVKEHYYKTKMIYNWMKRCHVCWCCHPYTKEVFWYNWFKKDWTRRLHSVCIKARLQIKRNITIMKDERYRRRIELSRINREKNKNNWKSRKIEFMTEEEKEKLRESRRKTSRKKYYLKKKKWQNTKVQHR